MGRFLKEMAPAINSRIPIARIRNLLRSAKSTMVRIMAESDEGEAGAASLFNLLAMRSWQPVIFETILCRFSITSRAYLLAISHRYRADSLKMEKHAGRWNAVRLTSPLDVLFLPTRNQASC